MHPVRSPKQTPKSRSGSQNCHSSPTPTSYGRYSWHIIALLAPQNLHANYPTPLSSFFLVPSSSLIQWTHPVLEHKPDSTITIGIDTATQQPVSIKTSALFKSMY